MPVLRMPVKWIITNAPRSSTKISSRQKAIIGAKEAERHFKSRVSSYESSLSAFERQKKEYELSQEEYENAVKEYEAKYSKYLKPATRAGVQARHGPKVIFAEPSRPTETRVLKKVYGEYTETRKGIGKKQEKLVVSYGALQQKQTGLEKTRESLIKQQASVKQKFKEIPRGYYTTTTTSGGKIDYTTPSGKIYFQGRGGTLAGVQDPIKGESRLATPQDKIEFKEVKQKYADSVQLKSVNAFDWRKFECAVIEKQVQLYNESVQFQQSVRPTEWQQFKEDTSVKIEKFGEKVAETKEKYSPHYQFGKYVIGKFSPTKVPVYTALTRDVTLTPFYTVAAIIREPEKTIKTGLVMGGIGLGATVLVATAPVTAFPVAVIGGTAISLYGFGKVQQLYHAYTVGEMKGGSAAGITAVTHKKAEIIGTELIPMAVGGYIGAKIGGITVKTIRIEKTYKLYEPSKAESLLKKVSKIRQKASIHDIGKQTILQESRVLKFGKYPIKTLTPRYLGFTPTTRVIITPVPSGRVVLTGTTKVKPMKIPGTTPIKYRAQIQKYDLIMKGIQTEKGYELGGSAIKTRGGLPTTQGRALEVQMISKGKVDYGFTIKYPSGKTIKVKGPQVEYFKVTSSSAKATFIVGRKGSFVETHYKPIEIGRWGKTQISQLAVEFPKVEVKMEGGWTPNITKGKTIKKFEIGTFKEKVYVPSLRNEIIISKTGIRQIFPLEQIYIKPKGIIKSIILKTGKPIGEQLSIVKATEVKSALIKADLIKPITTTKIIPVSVLREEFALSQVRKSSLRQDPLSKLAQNLESKTEQRLEQRSRLRMEQRAEIRALTRPLVRVETKLRARARMRTRTRARARIRLVPSIIGPSIVPVIVPPPPILGGFFLPKRFGIKSKRGIKGIGDMGYGYRPTVYAIVTKLKAPKIRKGGVESGLGARPITPTIRRIKWEI